VPKLQQLIVRFAGARQTAEYTLVVNHRAPVIVPGNKLASDGYTLKLDAGS
jgi:hypothetical protein